MSAEVALLRRARSILLAGAARVDRARAVRSFHVAREDKASRKKLGRLLRELGIENETVAWKLRAFITRRVHLARQREAERHNPYRE